MKRNYSFTVNTKKNVIYDLYDTLLKLRYPEVAQTSFNEFESTILTGTKRIDLLSWIIQKNANTNNDPLSKMKDNSINDKLVKCYAQIGLCTDENVLLGKCDMDNQLDFLSLLTVFIQNVNSTDHVTSKNDQNANNVSEGDANITLSSNLPVYVTCRNSDEQNSNSNITKPTELIKNLNTQQCIHSHSIDELCSDIKQRTNDLNMEDLKWNPVLQEFKSSFKQIASLPIQDTNPNIYSSYNELNADIEKISSLFSTVNKTLINESQMKNRPVIDRTVKSNKELSEVLQNNLVAIEQACNIFNDVC